MDTIWALILAAGIPSAITGLLVRRYEKKLEADRKAREEAEEARKEYEKFNVHVLTACIKLSEANAIALQNGKCNGETHAALDYLTQVRREQRKFLIDQGIDHIF